MLPASLQTFIIVFLKVVNCEPCGFGCNGGDVYTTFNWMVQTNAFKGLPKAAAVPYTSDKSGVADKCSNPTSVVPYSKPTRVTRVTYQPGVLNQLKTALSSGPVAVSITAASAVFQLYTSGIITDLTCGNASTTDHVVLAVGYGVINGVPYIKCKNSWGTLWGDNGFVYIGADESQNYCGVLSDFSYPSL